MHVLPLDDLALEDPVLNERVQSSLIMALIEYCRMPASMLLERIAQDEASLVKDFPAYESSIVLMADISRKAVMRLVKDRLAEDVIIPEEDVLAVVLRMTTVKLEIEQALGIDSFTRARRCMKSFIIEECSD